MLNLGYACMNMELSAKGITAARTCRKATFESKGLDHVAELFESNLNSFIKIMEWNVQNNYTLFRMSSDMSPWSSEYNLEDLPNWEKCQQMLKQVGNIARENGIRLSFHPGQFVCLASKNEKVITNAMKDLETHGKLMDEIGMPRNRWAKINIHMGGAYGDLQSAADRFLENFAKLSPSVQTRLTLENDDRPNLFSTKDLFELICQRSDIPIVFDYHHHAAHPGNMSEKDALEMAISTWGDVKPTCHYSESAQLERGKAAPFRAHSKFIYSKINDYGHDLDVMVEAKNKEEAVAKYIKDWGV